MKRRLLILAILIVPSFLVLIHLGEYAYSQSSVYSDLTISHLPYAEFIRQGLFADHQIPFWYPGLYGGVPLSGHPLAGLWYLPNWLGILIPAPFGFNLEYGLHLLIAGLGMFLFLRGLKSGDFGAIIGAIAFELAPISFAHFAAGHVSLCFAYSLTPWLMVAEVRADKDKRWQWTLITGAFLGMIILADVRWVLYAGLLWIFFRGYRYLTSGRERPPFFRWLLQILATSLIALFISAPFLLDFLDFTFLSTRTTLTVADVARFSLPVDQLFGLVFPSPFSYVEWVIYPGVFVLFLAGWLLGSKGGWKRLGFWGVLTLIALFIALGWINLSWLPLANLARVPSRALLLVNFGAIVLAGMGLDALIRGEESGILPRPASWLIITGIMAMAVLVSLGVILITGTAPLEFIWGMAAAILAFSLLMLWKGKLIGRRGFLAGVVTILCLDMGGVSYMQIHWMDQEQIDQQGAVLATQVKEMAEGSRIYSPNYQLPQLAAERAGLEMISGIDPMQLVSFSDYLYEAANVQRGEYSVTLPPLNGDPIELSNLDVVPRPTELGWMNVGILLTSQELPNPSGWDLVKVVDGTAIYKNLLVKPRAWVQNNDQVVEEAFRRVTIIDYAPNLIKIQANGPGWLVLAEVNYPGWKAYVDGEPEEIVSLQGLMRMIQLPPGKHEVEFSYQPRYLVPGVILGCLGWIAVILVTRKGRR